MHSKGLFMQSIIKKPVTILLIKLNIELMKEKRLVGYENKKNIYHFFAGSLLSKRMNYAVV